MIGLLPEVQYMRIWRGNEGAARLPYPARCPSSHVWGPQMKPVLWFALTIAVAFWAMDKLAFDGEYSTKIWQQGNS